MDKKYIRNQDFIFRKIVDETILVPIRHDVAELNCIYSLNEVGTLIWQKLVEPQEISALREAVLAEFDATPEQVSIDVDLFLAELSEFGAVQEV